MRLEGTEAAGEVGGMGAEALAGTLYSRVREEVLGRLTPLSTYRL